MNPRPFATFETVAIWIRPEGSDVTGIKPPTVVGEVV
jgi:hypothetical protein